MKQCLSRIIRKLAFLFLAIHQRMLERKASGEFDEQVSRQLDAIQALLDLGKPGE